MLTASITYLVMLEDFCPVYNGIPLNENSGWEQINEGIEVLINKVFQDENWFHTIASYASKAPSGHNTQPWKFHITDSTITVLPNLDVALPVVDRNNRELFISLGCAIENLCIAASYFGYTTHIIECSIEAIILELTKMISQLKIPYSIKLRNDRQTAISIMAIKYQMEFYNNFNPFQKKWYSILLYWNKYAICKYNNPIHNEREWNSNGWYCFQEWIAFVDEV